MCSTGICRRRSGAPIQETSYDRLKAEFCHVVFDSLSFIKRLPVASSFLLVLTTLVSIGRELMLSHTSKYLAVG